MRFLLTAFAASLIVGACTKTAGQEAYDNLQACFTDHINPGAEGLTPPEAIATCCIDHPIAGKTVVCGATAGDCMTFVRAQLDATTIDADIQTGCADYIKNKP